METPETKILIVDDSPQMSKLVRRYLENGGFQLSAASNGQMAIDKTLAESPDVVLLDFFLPDISGQDVLKRIKEINADTAVIVMTGHGGEDIAVKLMKAGAADYLSKPFDRETLLKSLEEVLKIRDLILKRSAELTRELDEVEKEKKIAERLKKEYEGKIAKIKEIEERNIDIKA